MTTQGDAGKRSKVISSQANQQLRRIRTLRTRQERERTGLYYIEGIKFIAQATRYNAEIELLLISPHLLNNPLGEKLLRHHTKRGTPIIELTPEVLKSVSHGHDPQGVGAVVRQKWLPLEQVKLDGKLCWLAIETIQSPGNLGTILRTSDVVGGAGVILLGSSVDPYDPSTVRATMGALFSQRFVRTIASELVAWKEPRQWLLVGTSPNARIDYQAVRYDAPTVLLLGDEKKGLSPELQGICDLMVRIPMVGYSDSLNVAVAASVVLYELFNQRRAQAHR